MGSIAVPRRVILVEGMSDQAALRTLAVRRGRDLDAEGVAIVAMGGATNIGSFLRRFGPHGDGLVLAGLCDAAEESDFRRGLERVGLGTDLTRAEMERLGFFVCEADLEDELIRSLGVAAVQRVIEARGDGGALRTFRNQPAWRGRSEQEQLRRFMGTTSGRKILYARLLVEALAPRDVPRPLAGVLDHA